MDSVRGLAFVSDIDSLASISEDCTVKLWSIRNMVESKNDKEALVEPYITLRGHTGPLFCVESGCKLESKQGRIIYTAGSEG